jgi:hypothetical protein
MFGNVLVLVKDKLPSNVSLEFCLKKIESCIPYHLVYGLDSMFVGQFPEFEERQINAFYRDGAIYITNEQDNDDDFVDDVVHEIAHLVEQTYGNQIYDDDRIALEFLGKRQRLFYLLKGEGYTVEPADFMKIEYDKDFDMFLFESVGYEKLSLLTQGLFLTPYGVTSMAEYFAESFETYFLQNQQEVKEVSPNCYRKIEKVVDFEDDGSNSY